MAFTDLQKAYSDLEIAKSESVVTVQSQFRTKYGLEPPTNKTIHAWFRKFGETGCLCVRENKLVGNLTALGEKCYLCSR